MRHVHGLLILTALVFTGALPAEDNHGTGPTARREAPGATPVKEQAKHIFKGKCLDCHGGADGDPYGAFGMDGLPTAEKMAKVAERMARPEAQRGHMPPKGDEQLSDKEKEIVAQYMAGEKKEEPPKQTCEVQRMPDLRLRPAEIMGDGQALQIMKKACVGCHGTYFSFKGKDFLIPTRAAVKEAKNLLRLPHTKFLNEDGSFNAEMIASGKESVGRIMNQIVGVDGRAFMPPSSTPKAMMGHYNEEDRARITKWLQQQLTDDLPKGCQVFAVKKPTPKAMTFAEAQKACGDNGSRVPNADQMKKLQADLKGEFGGKGCVWTSGFSNDGKMPRSIWSYDVNSEAKATSNAGCFAACIR